MPKKSLPEPTLALDRQQARRFLLAHQGLLPPRGLEGKGGILDFVRHVGCIQFDPIDLVGRNPDLVLQSRVGDYRPVLLEELLYSDRVLVDGWDKVAAIYCTPDWPYFCRHRDLMRRRYGDPLSPPMQVAPFVLGAIRERGPLESRDLKHEERIVWSWGHPTRLVRASLEVLSAMAQVHTHHRVRSVRYFDLIERVLPAEILAARDPHPTEEAYQDWHVLRRVGGLGLAPASGAPEYWLGIPGVRTAETRGAVLTRLVEQGRLAAVRIEEAPRRTFFLRTQDLPTLAGTEQVKTEQAAAFLAPLDNLCWDRELLREIFDFDYCWEVYKPASVRRYGYYVLPVLCGDRFVARCEPRFDKTTRTLTVAGWWWEKGIRPNASMRQALVASLNAFARYLGAGEVRLAESLADDKLLQSVLPPGRPTRAAAKNQSEETGKARRPCASSSRSGATRGERNPPPENGRGRPPAPSRIPRTPR